MLNISPHIIENDVKTEKYESFSENNYSKSGKFFPWLASFIMIVLIGFLFLPWTQNIQTKGQLTALSPQDRPQTINAVIGGKIDKWYVQEGQFVKAGDTIAHITEIKETYFDPQLLQRMESQIEAKEQYRGAYQDKTGALDNQIVALEKTMKLKMDQIQNKILQNRLKITTDSMDLIASQANYNIAKEQLDRQQELYNQGLKSKTELEARQLKFQEAIAKLQSSQNKLLTSRAELQNAQIEFVNTSNEYGEKLAKAESDRFSAISGVFDSDAEILKMRNQFMNYSIRSGFYYITAPRDGFVTKALRVGLGEIIKEGEPIVSIIPKEFQMAVEMYVEPIDLPLIQMGQKVMFRFDGWPSIVFSGWPNTSFGTFSGRVVAMDNFASDNGKYRVLATPDTTQKAWPILLKVGTGAYGIALLKEVPIWYELWRQLNAFPPDFYRDNPNPVNIKSDKDKKEDKEDKNGKDSKPDDGKLPIPKIGK